SPATASMVWRSISTGRGLIAAVIWSATMPGNVMKSPKYPGVHHVHRALLNSSITSVAVSSTDVGVWKSNFASARRIWADEEIGAAGPPPMSPIALASACAILPWVSMRSPWDSQITDILWGIALPSLWDGGRFGGAG